MRFLRIRFKCWAKKQGNRVHGIASARDRRTVGRVALKALVYFEVVTSLASVIGLVRVNLLQPRVGMNIDVARIDAGSVSRFADQARHVTATSAFLLDIIARTAFEAFARGDKRPLFS
jgi:aerobic C4-dicarboxylate transport protein